MNLTEKSIKELEKILDEYDIPAIAWNEFARQKHLASAINLIIHFDVNKWEEVKYKVNRKNRNINKKIEIIREELHKSIENNGLNSAKVRELSDRIDKLIATYYKDNRSKDMGRFYKEGDVMGTDYNRSYQYLKSLTIDLNEFPSVELWDKFAKKNNCLSSSSMQYISGFNWHKLRERVKSDVRLKRYKNVKKN